MEIRLCRSCCNWVAISCRFVALSAELLASTASVFAFCRTSVAFVSACSSSCRFVCAVLLFVTYCVEAEISTFIWLTCAIPVGSSAALWIFSPVDNCCWVCCMAAVRASIWLTALF